MHTKTVLFALASALTFGCQTSPNGDVDTANSLEFIGELRQNDSSSVFFNARFGWDSLFIDNGPNETVRMALTGRDTLRGTFPVFASELWLIKTALCLLQRYYNFITPL